MFLIKDETAGRLNALVKEIGGLTVMSGILDGTLKFTIMPQMRKFLGQVREIVLPKSTRSSDFQTGKGLWVSSDFDRLVGSGKATKLPEMKIGSFDLINSADDTEIRGELPTDHVFKATEIRGVLKTLIGLQPGGEEGNLLSNGYANLFYVEGVNGA